MPAVQFWLLHAAIVGGAAVVMAIFAVLFHKTLAPEAAAAEPAPA
jgi:hypothetical protein